jgi:hypothetical protein
MAIAGPEPEIAAGQLNRSSISSHILNASSSPIASATACPFILKASIGEPFLNFTTICSNLERRFSNDCASTAPFCISLRTIITSFSGNSICSIIPAPAAFASTIQVAGK